jgi:pyridoxine kinase
MCLIGSCRTLTGVPLDDPTSLRRALSILHHEHHVPNVVISSMPAGSVAWTGFPTTACPQGADASKLIACICSMDDGEPIVHTRAVPLIPGYFSGVGDLFSALVLAHFVDGNHGQRDSAGQTSLARATAAALAKTHAVLSRTQTHFSGLPADEQTTSDEELDAADPERKVARMRARELRLVQSQDIIRDAALGKEGMVLWQDFGHSC